MTELLLTILGQAGDGGGAAEGAGGPLGNLGQYLGNPIVMMILMFGVIYFMLIRPQSKKRKEHESWLSSLKRGDSIITQGGIIGRITAVDDRTVTLEVARDTRIRITRSHIMGPDAAGGSGSNRDDKKGSGKKK